MIGLVKVFEGTDFEYYMDGYLKSNLDIAKKVNKDDWDFLYLVDGKERGGKSIFAQSLGKYLSPDTFCLDIICFTPEQFEKAIDDSVKGGVVIYDEAFGGLSSRASMSLVNRSIVKKLTEIGFKNLFIIIVLPSFFDVDRYVALWRSRALFHIYTGDGLERGYFGAYNEEDKKRLYLLGKKFYDYGVVKPNFRGRFTNKWLVDKKLYDDKKRSSVVSVKKVVDDFDDYFFDRVFDNPDLTHNERIRVLGIPESTYYYHLRLRKAKNINT